MNFKSVTINLLLATLSAGVLLQTLEAQAASITFGAWNADPFRVTEFPANTPFATGNANASPYILRAFAQAASTDDPVSRFTDSAVTLIRLTNFFTVTPETGERNGDQVRAVLDGTLEGFYAHSGQDAPGILNSFTWVTADVNAGGFARWTSTRPVGIEELLPGFESAPADEYIVTPPGRRRITEPIFREGYLTIGETYELNMSLEVYAQKTGIYQATSNFGGDNGGLRLNIRAEAVPEPLTILGSATGLGFAAFFKRKHSKKQKKS